MDLPCVIRLAANRWLVNNAKYHIAAWLSFRERYTLMHIKSRPHIKYESSNYGWTKSEEACVHMDVVLLVARCFFETLLIASENQFNGVYAVVEMLRKNLIMQIQIGIDNNNGYKLQ